MDRWNSVRSALLNFAKHIKLHVEIVIFCSICVPLALAASRVLCASVSGRRCSVSVAEARKRHRRAIKMHVHSGQRLRLSGSNTITLDNRAKRKRKSGNKMNMGKSARVHAFRMKLKPDPIGHERITHSARLLNCSSTLGGVYAIRSLQTVAT